MLDLANRRAMAIIASGVRAPLLSVLEVAEITGFHINFSIYELQNFSYVFNQSQVRYFITFRYKAEIE